MQPHLRSIFRNSLYFIAKVLKLILNSKYFLQFPEIAAVEEAVAGGFADVGGEDVGAAGKVGDGAGDANYTGVGSGGQAEAVYYALQQRLATPRKRAETLHQGVGHLCIRTDSSTLETL